MAAGDRSLRGAVIDSAGLGALIGGIRRTRELGGSAALACSRPTLVRLFRNTGMDRIAALASSVEEAAELLRETDPLQQTDLCSASNDA